MAGAKVTSSGGRGLNYTAKLNISEAVKAAQALKKELASIGVATTAAAPVGLKNVTQAVKDSAAAVQSASLTWKEFVGQRMGQYMKDLGGHAPAIKKISEEWKEYKATIGSVSATKVNLGTAKTFDVKPLTDYQAALIRLKTELNEKNKIWKDLLITEQKSRNISAESRAEVDKLKKSEQELNLALKQKAISLAEYNLAQKKLSDQQKNAVAIQKEADRQARESRKAISDQIKAERALEVQKERNRKQLQRESSEYYQLNTALNAVRRRTKDVLAAMFELERQGKKNTDAYRALEQRSKGMVTQTQILDAGIKKIDTTLGLHQRHVGDYGRALENISPQFAAINSRLAVFGTSIQELSAAGGVSAFGTSLMAVGKNLLAFLVTPVGMAVAAIGALYALFVGNKQVVIDFDDRLLNVAKTTNLAGKELYGLGDAMIALSKKLETVSTVSLLEYASVAGQLGVRGTKDILEFAESLAKLETASDIKGEEGAKQIARLLNLVDGGVQNVQSFGDEIVNLGNNFAATEREILANAEAIAQNTGIYRVGRQDILAYATATKASGLEAEVVGSTFNRTLGIFEKAIRTGNNIEELSKKTGKSVAQLKSQFKDNAADVFNEFINGLHKVDQEGGSVNAVLESLGIVAIRDKRVIATLATNGYDTLTKALANTKAASGALNQEFGTASSKIANQAARFGIAWDNLVLSVENGQGVIGRSTVAVVGFFADIVDAISPASSAYKASAKEINTLVSRYDELTAKAKSVGGQANLTQIEQEELRSVTAKIGEILPGVTTKMDDYGRSLDINRDKIRKYTKAQSDMLELQNRAKIEAARAQFNQASGYLPEARKEAMTPNKTNSTYDRIYNFLYGGDRKSDAEVGTKDRVTRLSASAYEAAKAIRDLGGVLTGAEKKIIDYYEALEKTGPTKITKKTASEDDITDTVRTVDAIKADIKRVTELKKPLDTASKQYKVYLDQLKGFKEELRKANGGKDTEAISVENKYQTALKARNALQAQIDALTKKGTDKQLSADEQELASVQDKYAKMLKAARDFNNDPKNKAKGLRVDSGGILNAQSNEETAIRDKQDTAKLKVTLDEQKKLYGEYEDYKLKVGEDKANERYAKLINTDRTYLQTLLDQEDALTNSDKSKGGNEVDVAGNQLKLKLLREQIATEKLEVQKKDDEVYANAYSAAMTSSQALLKIEKEYQRDVKALGKDATAEQLDNLKRVRSEAIKSHNETNALQTSGYEKLMDDYDEMTRKHLIKELNAIKEKNIQAYKDGKINAEQLAALNGSVDSNLDNLNKDNPFAKVTQALKDYRQQVKLTGADSEGAKKYFDVLKEAADAAGEYVLKVVDDIEESLNNAGLVSNGLQSVIDKAKEAIKNVKGIVSGASEIGAGITNKDPIAVVTGSIKLLTSAIALFGTKDKKLQKQIDDYKKQLDSLGKAYKQLERDVNNSVGESYYSDSAAQIKNLEAQQAQLEKMRDAEAKKKKSDAAKVQEYQDQIDDIPNQIEDITKAISQNLIQTTFKDLSTSLADAFNEAFAAGEDAAGRFDDAFNKVIVNAIQNSLKLKLLEPIISDFTDELTQYAQDNNNSVVGFDFETWKKAIAAKGKLYTEGLEAVKDYLPDGTSSTDSALSKGITQITSDQASALEGITRGTYDLTKRISVSADLTNTLLIPVGKTLGDIYISSTANLAYQAEIATNTANTVVELKNAVTELKVISKNTTATSIRGSGLG